MILTLGTSYLILRNCLVPLARLGLHAEKSVDADPAEVIPVQREWRAAGGVWRGFLLIISLEYEKNLQFFMIFWRTKVWWYSLHRNIWKEMRTSLAKDNACSNFDCSWLAVQRTPKSLLLLNTACNTFAVSTMNIDDINPNQLWSKKLLTSDTSICQLNFSHLKPLDSDNVYLQGEVHFIWTGNIFCKCTVLMNLATPDCDLAQKKICIVPWSRV
jgi:hypothetical protein